MFWHLHLLFPFIILGQPRFIQQKNYLQQQGMFLFKKKYLSVVSIRVNCKEGCNRVSIYMMSGSIWINKTVIHRQVNSWGQKWSSRSCYMDCYWNMVANQRNFNLAKASKSSDYRYLVSDQNFSTRTVEEENLVDWQWVDDLKGYQLTLCRVCAFIILQPESRA